MTTMGRKTKQRRRPTATIESGVELRPCSTTLSFGKPISLSASIRKLQPGQSFRIDNYEWRRRATATASFVGIPIRTTRDNEGRLIITRLEDVQEE